MKRKTKQGIAAFAITGIVMLALCGFVAVDLSADHYMPGQFAPMLELSDITENGLQVSLFGDLYRVEPARLDGAKEWVRRYRALLPDSLRIAAHLTAQGYAAAVDYLEQTSPLQEPW